MVASAESYAMPALGLDITVDPYLHDIMSDIGFSFWLNVAMDIASGGTAVIAHPCQSFIWLARGHTLRPRSRPKGNTCRPDVNFFNAMARRVCVLCLVLTLRDVFWVIEQPTTSTLFWLPCMINMLKFVKMRGIFGFKPERKQLWLSHYGHKMAKSTVLIGILPGVRYLKSKRPQDYHVRKVQTIGWFSWVNAAGRRRFMGKHKLKMSQAYPRLFTDDLIKCARYAYAHASVRSSW